MRWSGCLLPQRPQELVLCHLLLGPPRLRAPQLHDRGPGHARGESGARVTGDGSGRSWYARPTAACLITQHRCLPPSPTTPPCQTRSEQRWRPGLGPSPVDRTPCPCQAPPCSDPRVAKTRSHQSDRPRSERPRHLHAVSKQTGVVQSVPGREETHPLSLEKHPSSPGNHPLSPEKHLLDPASPRA